jgi:uncharacterized membrane protein YbaN (DUF454 family)
MHPRVGRLVCGVLGWCCVALALAGVFVPGLPVTVFVLTASWLFARSSPRFQAWLESNRWLGPPLRRFRERRGMPRQAKVAAIASMWTAIAFSSAVLAATYPAAAVAVVLLGAVGTLTILFGVRTVPPADA